MRILGIDPGSTVTGFGVVDADARRVVHVVHGTLRPPRTLNSAGRLSFIYEGIRAVIADHEPDAASAERIFVAAGRRSALVLGEARGAALAAVGAGGTALSEYSASQIKLAVSGSGRAAKEQVRTMVKRLLALDRVPATDAADALAAALCHAQSGRIGRLENLAARRGAATSQRVRRVL
jgi:crossover junction endodeoxyribonuclease RuvC